MPAPETLLIETHAALLQMTYWSWVKVACAVMLIQPRWGWERFRSISVGFTYGYSLWAPCGAFAFALARGAGPPPASASLPQ